MLFVDRNALARHNTVGVAIGGAANALGSGNPEEEKLPQSIEEASPDFECTLSDVISYLKKCGYPLENCFISFFSPVFSAYINCGLDPLPTSIKITSEDLTQINPDHVIGRDINNEEDQYQKYYKLLLKF